MILVHSNNHQWVRPFLPRHWHVRPQPLTDHSKGYLAALCDYSNGPRVMDTVRSLSERYDHVLVYLNEPWLGHNDGLLPRLTGAGIPNLMVFSDVILDRPLPNHQQISNWFLSHENFYSQRNWAADLIHRIHRQSAPPTWKMPRRYRFDALLGVARENKKVVHALWQKSAHKNKIFLTFHGVNPRRGVWHAPYRARPTSDPSGKDETLVTADLWTEMPCDDGINKELIGTANLLPEKIYSQCWYSIIAEGFFDHRGSRFTEKTAKALVAGRLFVLFGGPHDLKRLRRLGFKTFGSVIDESYDEITDDYQRWQAAWRVVEWLCQQNPGDIQALAHDIRQHNYKVFIETDWYKNLRQHLITMCAK